MGLITVRGRLLRWGNGFGLRLDRHDVERLDWRPGDVVEVQVEVGKKPIRPREARSFALGGAAADEHEARSAEAAMADLEKLE